MFGFPVNLQDSGVQKLTNDADNSFPKIQQREVFYSVRNGDWDDPLIWQTASGRIGKIPGQFDDVYVKHLVALNPNFTINNLFVSGRIYPIAGNRTYNINGNLVINHDASYDNNLNNGITINILGDIKCFGSFTMNNNSHVLRLYGQNNYIEKSKFTSSASSEINYERVGDQRILDLNYGVLSIYRRGIKTLQGDTIVQGQLNVQGDNDDMFFELGGFDFSVLGGTFIFRGSIRRSSSNPILFVGNVLINGNSPNSQPFILPGNCNVEFRGGISIGSNQSVYILGSSGTFSFTTNNQSISGNANDLFFDNPISIGAGVTLTIASSVRVYVNNTINGVDSTSRLTMGLNGQLYFNTAASVPSMSVGLYDFTTNANTIGYTGNYTATIPAYFPTFHSLAIAGTGTKSLGVNTTINGSLVVSQGIFELSTYNLNVTGTSIINGGTLKKGSSGNILFAGLLNVSSGFANAVDFTIGNPNVECRGGITLGLNISNIYQIHGGNGTWTFTTNNQSVNGNQGVSWIQLFNVIIADNITLSITTTNNVMLQINNSINGATSTSKLLGGTNGRIALNSNIQPMTTGIWDFTTNVCFVQYMSTSNQTIWHSTYSHLELANNSTKTLSTNTTINNTLNCFTNNINSIFELSNYNLSVNGTSTLAGKISKSGAGNILFVGFVNWIDLVGGIDFSGGNPTIETRNGFRYNNGSDNVIMILGSSVWNFTTNNQSLYGSAVGTYGKITGGQFNIANDITLSIGSSMTINGVFNGGNANSKLLMNTSVALTYNNSTQPMATGILDTFTNVNYWIYGNANQDIKGGPTTLAKQVYRNLTLNGGGTKTLQGYVSVLNTYTLTAPATLANNGFTLTNP